MAHRLYPELNTYIEIDPSLREYVRHGFEIGSNVDLGDITFVGRRDHDEEEPNPFEDDNITMFEGRQRKLRR